MFSRTGRPPFREAEFDLVFGKGINKYGDILDLGVRQGLIQKVGAWFTVNEERFQGRDNARAYLEENPDIAAEIEEQVRIALGLDEAEGEPTPAPELNGAAKNGAAKNGSAKGRAAAIVAELDDEDDED